VISETIGGFQIEVPYLLIQHKCIIRMCHDHSNAHKRKSLSSAHIFKDNVKCKWDFVSIFNIYLHIFEIGPFIEKL